ncbi:MAG: DUF1297 domain-containing protein [archaeon]|nr:MAG: DUF1297 domain-containing protein [archaeon]
MIERKEIQDIVEDYRPRLFKRFRRTKFSIAIFGSHSALELGMAAKAHKIRTVLIAQKGRDKVYKRNKHLYDKIITLNNFKNILEPRIQKKLRKKRCILVPNRSFSVYVEYKGIENDFRVPIYGNRYLLRAEDRKDEKGQYHILEKSGVRIPKKFEKPEDIDRLSIVKVQQYGNEQERAFFFAKDYKDYKKEAGGRLKKKIITEEDLKNARIEEVVLGARFNANFHFYGLKDVFGDFDFMGTSDREQVNLQGFLNLPAKDQLKITDVPILNEEIGHKGKTVRESKQPFFYDAAEKLYYSEILKKEYPPGHIGPIGIQGAIRYNPEKLAENKKELEFVVFDLSLRIPGDPSMGPTSPEMRNLSLKYGRKIEDPLDLVVMELEYAAKNNRLAEIVT